MKKIKLYALAIFLLIGIPVSVAFAFTDIEGERNEEAINYLYEKGVVEGYDDGGYHPDDRINRAEFVKILMESRYPHASTGSDCFLDVWDEWYARYVCNAHILGIIDGYDDGTFGPANYINLAEALKIVLETYEIEFTQYSEDWLWYVPYQRTAEDLDLLNYVYSDIDTEINRGEMAQLVYNLEGYLGNIDEIGENNDLPDLTVLDVYESDDGIYVVVGNTESIDADYYDDPVLQLYVDGDPYLAYANENAPDSEYYIAGSSTVFGPFSFDPDDKLLTVVIDDNDSVDESNETNNSMDFELDTVDDKEDKSCEYEGETYVEGEEIEYDECTVCNCIDGEISNCTDFCEEEERLGLCYDEDCLNEDPTYIIITRPLFLDTIQDFIQWKTDAGFEVGILTVDYIAESWGDENLAVSMKKAIQKYAEDHSTEYFLLIGDTTTGETEEYNQGYADKSNTIENMYNLDLEWNVPSGNRCSPSIEVDYANVNEVDCEDEWIPTDIYFADFDDESWELIEDGYFVDWANYQHMLEHTSFAEADLLVDYETIVARIPIREPEEFENIFYKIKNFEEVKAFDYISTMSEETFISSDCSSYMSANDASYEEGAKNKQGCFSSSTAIWQELIESYEYNFNFQYFDGDDDARLALASDALDKEENIIIIHSHGSVGGIEFYGKDDVNNFENIFALYISMSCNISWFAYPDDEVFAEALIKGEKGPAFYAQPMNDYFFYKGLLDGKTIGEAFYNVGEELAGYKTVSNPLFGDPSLPLFD